MVSKISRLICTVLVVACCLVSSQEPPTMTLSPPLSAGQSRRENLRICAKLFQQRHLAPVFARIINGVSFEMCMYHVYEESRAGLGFYCWESHLCGVDLHHPVPSPENTIGALLESQPCEVILDQRTVSCESFEQDLYAARVLSRVGCLYSQAKCTVCEDLTGAVLCSGCPQHAKFNQESGVCECARGFTYNDNDECVDDDECQHVTCPRPDLTCVNSAGSFACLPCPEGFSLVTGASYGVSRKQTIYGSRSGGEGVSSVDISMTHDTSGGSCYESDVTTGAKFASFDIDFAVVEQIKILHPQNETGQDVINARAEGMVLSVCDWMTCRECGLVPSSDWWSGQWSVTACDELAGTTVRVHSNPGRRTLEESLAICEVVVVGRSICERGAI